MPNIKPVDQALAELDGGALLDKLAAKVNEACNAVRHLGKPAKVTMTITIRPLTKTKLVDPPVLFTAEVAAKLPKPDVEATAMYLDEDDNPSPFPTTKPRERELNLQIGGRDE